VTKKKARNPQDATRRNVRASLTRDAHLMAAIARLQTRIGRVEEDTRNAWNLLTRLRRKWNL
jgi:hypothetical protein